MEQVGQESTFLSLHFCQYDMQLCIIFLCSCSQPKDGLNQLKYVAEWILKNKRCVRRLIIGTVHVAKLNLSNRLFVH